MPSEYTFFRFDVDEGTARWLLSSVPGVTPLPPDERGDASEGEAESSGGDVAASAVAGGERGSDERMGVTDGRPVESAGSQTRLDEPAPSGRGGSPATDDVRPSTPWPGAPTDEDDSDGGWLDRLGGKRVVIAAGLVLSLGVVGVAAVWFLRRRRGESSDGAGEDRWSGTRPSDREVEVTDPGPERSGDESPSEDDASRSYPVDVSPLVGIGFLSVVALVVRRYRSSDGS